MRLPYLKLTGRRIGREPHIVTNASQGAAPVINHSRHLSDGNESPWGLRRLSVITKLLDNASLLPLYEMCLLVRNYLYKSTPRVCGARALELHAGLSYGAFIVTFSAAREKRSAPSVLLCRIGSACCTFDWPPRSGKP